MKRLNSSQPRSAASTDTTESLAMRWALLSQVWPEEPEIVVSGSNVQVYYIARELARRGESVLVVLSSHSTPWERCEGNLSIVSIPALGRGLRGWLHPRWIQQATAVLQSFSPDIVYQRGKLPETILAAHYTRRHGGLFVWCSNADNSARPWKYIRKRLRYRRRPLWLLPARLAEAALADLLIQRALCSADLLIAQTQWQYQTLHRLLGREPILLGSGHPLPPPPSYAVREGPPTVLWLANVTPMKQPQVFLLLARRLQHIHARFLMAGAAPNTELGTLVRREAERLPNLTYLGPVAFRQTARLFATAQLFVLTSESEFEGLPNTFIQACLHGVPTLSLRNDPDGLIRTHGIGAVAADEEELVALVQNWIADPERRRQAGQKAYELACQAFDIRVIVERLTELVTRHLHHD